MKKWLLATAGFIILLIAVIYISIPSTIVISKISPVKCSVNGATRTLSVEKKWLEWWPQQNLSGKKGFPFFNFNGFSYHLSQKFYNSIEVTISDEEFTAGSRINIIKVSGDSLLLAWNCEVPSSLNPFKRMREYKKATHINEDMAVILRNLKSFLENNTNVYGVNIHQVISNDSTLITTKRITNTYPTTTLIYLMIDDLKKHIKEEGAAINNVPMLNVRFLPGPQFVTTVAIPIDRVLRETPTIENKRFVPWKTLVGDVKGGVSTIQHAQQQMQIYIDDYQRNAFGIPFELLITDRRLEPDTLKWITRICQAVS